MVAVAKSASEPRTLYGPVSCHHSKGGCQHQRSRGSCLPRGHGPPWPKLLEPILQTWHLFWFSLSVHGNRLIPDCCHVNQGWGEHPERQTWHCDWIPLLHLWHGPLFANSTWEFLLSSQDAFCAGTLLSTCVRIPRAGCFISLLPSFRAPWVTPSWSANHTGIYTYLVFLPWRVTKIGWWRSDGLE